MADQAAPAKKRLRVSPLRLVFGHDAGRVARAWRIGASAGMRFGAIMAANSGSRHAVLNNDKVSDQRHASINDMRDDRSVPRSGRAPCVRNAGLAAGTVPQRLPPGCRDQP